MYKNRLFSKRDSSSKEGNSNIDNDPDNEMNRVPHFLLQTRDRLLKGSTDSLSDYKTDPSSSYQHINGDSTNIPASSGSVEHKGVVLIKRSNVCCQAVTMNQK